VDAWKSQHVQFVFDKTDVSIGVLLGNYQFNGVVKFLIGVKRQINYFNHRQALKQCKVNHFLFCQNNIVCAIVRINIAAPKEVGGCYGPFKQCSILPVEIMCLARHHGK